MIINNIQYVVSYRFNDQPYSERFDNWLDANMRFFKLVSEGKDPSFHEACTDDLKEYAINTLMRN